MISPPKPPLYALASGGGQARSTGGSASAGPLLGASQLTVPDAAADQGVSLPGCGEAVHPAPWIAVSGLLSYR